MSYYKRATVFLALSRSRPALTDLDKVLKLKPDFSQARVKRGIVLLKQGRLDEAHIDLEKAVAKEPGTFVNFSVSHCRIFIKDRSTSSIFLFITKMVKR